MLGECKNAEYTLRPEQTVAAKMNPPIVGVSNSTPTMQNINTKQTIDQKN